MEAENSKECKVTICNGALKLYNMASTEVKMDVTCTKEDEMFVR